MSGVSSNFIPYVHVEIPGFGGGTTPLPPPPSCFKYNEKQAARSVKNWPNVNVTHIYNTFKSGHQEVFCQKQGGLQDSCSSFVVRIVETELQLY